LAMVVNLKRLAMVVNLKRLAMVHFQLLQTQVSL